MGEVSQLDSLGQPEHANGTQPVVAALRRNERSETKQLHVDTDLVFTARCSAFVCRCVCVVVPVVCISEGGW